MSDIDSNIQNNIVEIKTIQSNAFKILIEALKEILTDTCLEIDESGIKITAMDTSHIVLVHMKLDASNFEFYHCLKKTSIGINMLNFHKLIKTINSNDTLSLIIQPDDINHLVVKIENSEKNSKTMYKLNLLDLDSQSISIDPVEFNSVITLPSIDFQKIIRDMNNLSDFVEIRNINKQLIFSCKGDFCDQETIISDSSIDNKCKVQSKCQDEIIQGFFHLKYMTMFTKCTNLCNTVELYLKNDYPIIVKYEVASLGSLKLCLAPCNDNR